MTLKFISTDDDNFLKSISIRFTQGLFTGGAEGVGDIGVTLEITLGAGSLEKSTSSKAGFALTQLYMNSITSEPTGCGAEARRSQEKMKRDTLRSLMKSLEDLFESLEKLSQR